MLPIVNGSDKLKLQAPRTMHPISSPPMTDALWLREELFCQQFELKTLAEILLRNESERWVPHFIHSNTEHDHLARYELAKKYVENSLVLDIACGAGRGSWMLAQDGLAAGVTACDLNEDAVRYARWRNKHDKVTFEVQDAERFKVDDAFDVVVSFETIEHLKNVHAFLGNVRCSLKNGGVFIVSTPISRLEVDTAPSNPYHVQEWGFRTFQKLIGEHFLVDEIYLQLFFFQRTQPQDKKRSLVRRVWRKFTGSTNASLGTMNTVSKPNSKPIPIVAHLEKFEGQYTIHEIETERVGYQILVCIKR